jgi:hypothetical protein
LVLARYSGEYGRDVLINIGASVLIVALSYAIFDPVFEQIRLARVQEQSFDDAVFCRNVARASREVRIMDTCNHILEGPGRNALLDALTEAARRSANIEILLLDPDSAATEQRAGEISDDVRAKVVENLYYLQECRRQLPDTVRDRLQVRIYDALPSIQFFQYDDRALVSFFPAGGRASASTHLEIAIDTPLGEFVRGRFGDLWGHTRTSTLETWLNVDVSFWDDAHVLDSRSLRYLCLEDSLFLDATPVRNLLESGDRHSLRVELRSSRPAIERNSFYVFDRPPSGGDQPSRSVLENFAKKYGDTYGPGDDRLIVALHPVRPVS